jgi:PAS domain S-box-containing protein
MKLLIVDDHESNLKLLRAQLEAKGHAVVEAGNGVEALQLLETERVDGVISDILMPQMDGYRLCMEIRKSKRHRAIPLLLYTATFNSSADRALAKASGADAYLVKPTPTQAILDALQAAANQPHADTTGNPADEIASPVLQQYNRTLVRKLEKKCQDLEIASDELAQAEARLSGLVESSMDGIIAIDKEQRIVLFNPAAGRIFNCLPAEAIGRPLNDFIPQKFRQEHTTDIHAFSHAPPTGRHMGGREVWGLRSDGSEFPIEVSISKLETP